MNIDPLLTPLLEREDLENIDSSSNTIYGVWADLRLALINQGWFRFASSNGGAAHFFDRWSIGESLEPVCRGPGGELFGDGIRDALASQQVQTITYECSSADTFRLMQANIFPLGDQAVLISHALIRTSSHSDEGRDSHAPTSEYVNDDGLIVMCSGCRCVRRTDDPTTWDWVPEFVAEMPENVSHGFCAACLGYWSSPVATPRRF